MIYSYGIICFLIIAQRTPKSPPSPPAPSPPGRETQGSLHKDSINKNKTKSAVIQAQSFFKITQDGICGQETWGKLLEYKK
jgi:hypothetical protein